MRKRRTMAKVVGFGHPDYSGKEETGSTWPPRKVSDLIDQRQREYFGRIIGGGQDSFEHTIEAILRVSQRSFDEANAANAKADGTERMRQGSRPRASCCNAASPSLAEPT